MEARDNVTVSIRIRPINSREHEESQGLRCIAADRTRVQLNNSPRTFTFNYVAHEAATQHEVFQAIGQPIAASCLAGYNGTIFAYGQTGSGKTYTILGTEKDPGLLPRSLESIFCSVKKEVKQTPGVEFFLKVTYVEIYNEQIFDLLNTDHRNLHLREDVKRGVFVEGMEEETVFILQEALDLLARGNQTRHTGETLMNRESSRSHSVFTLTIESKERHEDVWNFRTARFHLIDLAGSERQKLTAASGDRLKEAGMINKSLSVLGSVINSLVEVSEGKQRHVHYRDSKLTFLLKDSLGGNSKTSIIANVSPSAACTAETLSTLRFAERAKFVQNKAVVNEDTVGTVSELKEEIGRLKLLLSQRPVCEGCYRKDVVEEYMSLGTHNRIAELEAVLGMNTKLRVDSEAVLQREIENRENHVVALMQAIQKYEAKLHTDKMIIRFREETIKRFKSGSPCSEDTQQLLAEIELLRKTVDNHPVAAKLLVEKDALEQHVRSLKRELKEAPDSLVQRLKASQEYTEVLAASIAKSANEREALLQSASMQASTAQLAHLEGKLAKKTEQLKAVRDQLNTLSAAHTQLQTEWKHLCHTNHELEIENNALQEGVNQLQVDVQVKEIDLNNLFHENQYLQFLYQQQEHTTPANDQVQELQVSCEQLKNQRDHLHSELQLSLTNREQLLGELKRLQTSEHELFKQNEDLQRRLQRKEAESRQLHQEVTVLSSENSKLVGHNNVNQKIKIYTRLKEENNALKEQNHRLKNESCKATDQLARLQKKYDLLVQTKNLSDFDTWHEQMQSLETALSHSNGLLTAIAKRVTGTANKENCDVWTEFNEFYQRSVRKDQALEAKQKELDQQAGRLRLLENELLLYQQKAGAYR